MLSPLALCVCAFCTFKTLLLRWEIVGGRVSEGGRDSSLRLRMTRKRFRMRLERGLRRGTRFFAAAQDDKNAGSRTGLVEDACYVVK